MSDKLDKSVDLSLDTQESSSIRLSQIGGDSTLSMSNDELMQSGHTDEFISFLDKDPSAKTHKKKMGAIERKQMHHDLQLLRIELSQKSLVIDNLKNEHMNQIDELEERLHDALYKKQRLQAQLDNAVSLNKAESKKMHDKTEKDLKIILARQEELEKANRLLEDRASNARGQIESAELITKQQYIDLKSQPVESLTIAQYFSLRLYEGMEPLTLDRKNIIGMRDQLSADVVKLSNSLHTTEQELINERRERGRLDAQHRSQTAELTELRKQLEVNLGKVQRFEIVYAERNKLDCDYNEVMKRNVCLEAEEKNSAREICQLKGELQTITQEAHLLKQDKEYLTRNLTETQVKLQTAEDQLSRANQQMEAIKSSREELYEKYASSREEARSVYEQRLQDELSRLRMQTERELDKVRNDSKEAYERENRSLREARDVAMHERDQMSKLREDAEKRCEMYVSEVRALEGNMESRVSDLHNTAHVKTFELDRLHLVHDETRKNLERAQIDNEKKTRKLELVTADFGELQRKTSIMETELRNSISDLKSRLSVYESLEKEMDDIVMQAAEVEDDTTGKVDEAERILFSYGYGANVPVTAKRRMKQSVHLARRVLQLEKINTGQRNEIDQLKEEIKVLRQKLISSEKLLDDANQPMSYMVESMRKRDEEIEAQRKVYKNLEKEVQSLKKENGDLTTTKRQMALDLDKLLAHRQELSLIKGVLSKMAASGGSLGSALDLGGGETLQQKRSRNLHMGRSAVDFGDQRNNEVNNPAPVVFTRAEKEDFNKEKYRKFKNLGLK